MASVLKKFKKGWQERILALGRDGASYIEMAEELDMLADGLRRRLKKEHPIDEELGRTLKRAVQLSEIWWMKTGKNNMKTRDFNAGLYMIQMGNRFKWKRRDDITTDDKPIENQNVIQIGDVPFNV